MTRSLLRSPALTLTAVVAGAIGLGAATAVFTAVDPVLFRRLAYPEEERLASVGMLAPLDTNEFLFASGYFALRRLAGSPFAEVTAFQAGAFACDLGETDAVRLRCLRVEANFLKTLGTPPVAGASFTAEDDRPGAPPVALISASLWRQRFGGEAAVAGRTVFLDGQRVRVAGVLPEGFTLPTLAVADVLLPLQLNEAREREGRALRAFGRLRAGVTVEAARAALAPWFAQVLETVPPQFRKEVHVAVRTVRERQMGEARLASWALFGGVLGVLLIACANVANLLLARAWGRRQETAIKTALGASRGQLLQESLVESGVLALASGFFGLGLAVVLLRVFVRLAPDALPHLEQAQLDWRVAGFALVLTLVTGVATGMVARPESMLAGARVTSPLRGALVVAQIALSLTLLTGAGLLLRTLWKLEAVPLGFEAEQVVAARFTLGPRRWQAPEAQLAFFRELEERLGQLPGVTAAAISDSLPPAGGTRGRPFSTIEVEGRPRMAEGTGGMVLWRYVTEGYFRTLGIPLRRGRLFEQGDRAPGTQPMVINETLARRWFAPGEDPVGRHVLKTRDGWSTIIGVVADARNAGVRSPVGPEYYLLRKPVADATFANAEPPMGWRQAQVVLRTGVEPALAVGALRSALKEMDATMPVEVEALRDRLDALHARPRFQAALIGAFGFVGLALAAAGLFGVLSFVMGRRGQEMGIRMALGATRAQIGGLAFSLALRWTALGVGLGLAGSVAVARALRSFLFGVEAMDPAAWVASALVLVLAAVGAAAYPAWRAAQNDPAVTLRS